MSNSQSKAILEALIAGDTLTPMDALRRFQCMRLGARIKDLRKKGHDIRTTIVNDGNKHYARYYLQSDRLRVIESISPFKQEPEKQKTNSLGI